MKYFSTFSGIGGFEEGILKVFPNAECVGFSEIDKYAAAIYTYHYPTHKNYGDITTINESGLPDFDLFVGGFPCQAFSIAGKRQGFEDTRGTLFFDVARILSAKKPTNFILENVKGLLSHDGGRTLATIYRVLTELGYTVGWEVVNSCQFGVPQNRERIFIVGHLGERSFGKILPIGETKERHINIEFSREITSQNRRSNGNIKSRGGSKNDINIKSTGSSGQPVIKIKEATKKGYIEASVGQSINLSQPNSETRRGRVSDISPTLDTGSNIGTVVKAVLTPDRVEKRQNGRRFKEEGEPSFTLTSQDNHGVQVNERIRILTPIECERLQGFKDDWSKYGMFEGVRKEISDTQRYKCLGNAVTATVPGEFIRRLL